MGTSAQLNDSGGPPLLDAHAGWGHGCVFLGNEGWHILVALSVNLGALTTHQRPHHRRPHCQRLSSATAFPRDLHELLTLHMSWSSPSCMAWHSLELVVT